MKLNTKSLIYGTLMLTLANFLVRLLGFVYRVFLSRILQPQGMGLFQLIFPVYMTAVTLTSSGIPVAVSRMVAERKAVGDYRGIGRVVSIALVSVTILSVSLSALILINIYSISHHLLQDPRTQLSLFIYSPCIVIVGLGAVLKGYFYGVKNVHPPALSGMVEQIIRIGLVMMLFYWMPSLNTQSTVALAVLGSVIGEMAGLLYLHYSYHKRPKEYPNSNNTIQTRLLCKKMLSIMLPITFMRFLSSLMTSANSILVPQRLAASGMSRDQAVSVFGIVSGMVMPLVFLPFTLTSALSVVIIPSISENMMIKNWNYIKDKIAKSILFTCITAFPSMALFIVLGKPLGILLYNQPMVGTLLIPSSLMILFHSLQHSLGAILNALGKQNKAALNFILGRMIQLLCTYFLVSHPSFNIYGFIIGFAVSSILVCVLHLLVILQSTKLRMNFMEWFIIPCIAGVIMMLGIKVIYELLAGINISALFSLLASAFAGCVIYVSCILMAGGQSALIIRPMLKSFLKRVMTFFRHVFR